MNVPTGKRFVRNGRPDGGAECYWELENGDIWIWQATGGRMVFGGTADGAAACKPGTAGARVESIS